MELEDLAKYLLEQIVTEPKSIKIERSEIEPDTVKLVATVDSADMGKVIGKGGKVIQAIRTLLGTAAIKQNKRIFFTLTEPTTEEGKSLLEESSASAGS